MMVGFSVKSYTCVYCVEYILYVLYRNWTTFHCCIIEIMWLCRIKSTTHRTFLFSKQYRHTEYVIFAICLFHNPFFFRFNRSYFRVCLPPFQSIARSIQLRSNMQLPSLYLLYLFSFYWLSSVTSIMPDILQSDVQNLNFVLENVNAFYPGFRIIHAIHLKNDIA